MDCFHEISMRTYALFGHLCLFINETLTRFLGCRGKGRGKSSTGLREPRRPEGVFEVSFAKTSKIIFIPFSITLSPCVFWSQHDSPLLLSPYSRWWRHTGGKSVLALARSNATMKKRLHFLGMKFFTAAIFSRRHAAIFLRAPLLLFVFHTRIAGICVRLLLFCPVSSIKKEREKKIAALCMWHVWSAARPQLKPGDKNIIAVSAGRKRIRAPQTGPFPILMGQTCEACGASGSTIERISLKSLEEDPGVFFIYLFEPDHQQSLTWSADR